MKEKVELLRTKYPEFIYQAFDYEILEDKLEIEFHFSILPDIKFSPQISIKGLGKQQLNSIEKKELDNLIFHLGMIEILSYWKATCSPIIRIKAGSLNKQQIGWWMDLIIKGMGQFFYENEIDFQKPNFLEIISQGKEFKSKEARSQKPDADKVLIPIGGGKDSIVSLEILAKSNKKIYYFALNPNSAILEAINKTGSKNVIIAERQIDKKLLELNRRGFLNGHTPFSAYLAFLCLLIADVSGIKFIALSNERSANQGNLKYLGKIINHQYSKSFEFEERFIQYSHKYLHQDIEYFSLLRPLYELQIARLFCQYSRHFSSFISCNEAFKTHSGQKKPSGAWCSNCSKCLFVFACLYPFLKREEIINIFQQNLFKKKELLPIMRALIGEGVTKPLECVGTKEESIIAFYLCLKRSSAEDTLPFLLAYFKDNILPKYPHLEQKSAKIMDDWDKNHCLPEEFKKILKHEVEQLKK